jgi:hypothetical protein
VDFLGPIGERYAGLYYSFMEQRRFDFDFHWYSGIDGKKLGNNARRAAVEEYNWERQAAKMGEFLSSLEKSNAHDEPSLTKQV